METGGHESHTLSQQIVSILPWTELGEEQGLPYKEFLEPTVPELDFLITQANPFLQCTRKYIGIQIQTHFISPRVSAHTSLLKVTRKSPCPGTRSNIKSYDFTESSVSYRDRKYGEH